MISGRYESNIGDLSPKESALPLSHDPFLLFLYVALFHSTAQAIYKSNTYFYKVYSYAIKRTDFI